MKPIPEWSSVTPATAPIYTTMTNMQQEIDALRQQVAYLTDLAQGRLEQMDADRKQYLDLRDKVKPLEADRDQYRAMWLREKEANDLRGGNGEAERVIATAPSEDSYSEPPHPIDVEGHPV